MDTEGTGLESRLDESHTSEDLTTESHTYLSGTASNRYERFMGKHTNKRQLAIDAYPAKIIEIAFHNSEYVNCQHNSEGGLARSYYNVDARAKRAKYPDEEVVDISTGEKAFVTIEVPPIDEFMDEVKCSICLGIFTEPIRVGGCSHRFCKDCLQKCLRTQHRYTTEEHGSTTGTGEYTKTCPECREKIGSQRHTHPDLRMENLIGLLSGKVQVTRALDNTNLQLSKGLQFYNAGARINQKAVKNAAKEASRNEREITKQAKAEEHRLETLAKTKAKEEADALAAEPRERSMGGRSLRANPKANLNQKYSEPLSAAGTVVIDDSDTGTDADSNSEADGVTGAGVSAGVRSAINTHEQSQSYVHARLHTVADGDHMAMDITGAGAGADAGADAGAKPEPEPEVGSDAESEPEPKADIVVTTTEATTSTSVKSRGGRNSDKDKNDMDLTLPRKAHELRVATFKKRSEELQKNMAHAPRGTESADSTFRPHSDKTTTGASAALSSSEIDGNGSKTLLNKKKTHTAIASGPDVLFRLLPLKYSYKPSQEQTGDGGGCYSGAMCVTNYSIKSGPLYSDGSIPVKDFLCFKKSDSGESVLESWEPSDGCVGDNCVESSGKRMEVDHSTANTTFNNRNLRACRMNISEKTAFAPLNKPYVKVDVTAKVSQIKQYLTSKKKVDDMAIASVHSEYSVDLELLANDIDLLLAPRQPVITYYNLLLSTFREAETLSGDKRKRASEEGDVTPPSDDLNVGDSAGTCRGNDNEKVEVEEVSEDDTTLVWRQATQVFEANLAMANIINAYLNESKEYILKIGQGLNVELSDTPTWHRNKVTFSEKVEIIASQMQKVQEWNIHLDSDLRTNITTLWESKKLHDKAMDAKAPDFPSLETINISRSYNRCNMLSVPNSYRWDFDLFVRVPSGQGSDSFTWKKEGREEMHDHRNQPIAAASMSSSSSSYTQAASTEPTSVNLFRLEDSMDLKYIVKNLWRWDNSLDIFFKPKLMQKAR